MDCSTFDISRFPPGFFSISAIPMRCKDIGLTAVLRKGSAFTVTCSRLTELSSSSTFTVRSEAVLTINSSDSFVLYPTLLTSSRLNPNGTFSIRKYPFSSAAVPMVVFQITTLAKGTGSLFLLSNTRPFTIPFCCACAITGTRNNRARINRITAFICLNIVIANVVKIHRLILYLAPFSSKNRILPYTGLKNIMTFFRKKNVIIFGV